MKKLKYGNKNEYAVTETEQRVSYWINGKEIHSFIHRGQILLMSDLLGLTAPI